jgi:translocation and assembly module TamB
MLPTHTHYKLQIRNTGDLLIKNNLAELEMNADLDMVGTLENPEMLGQLDFLNGSINAFGVDFEDASGFAQFKKGNGVTPEINLMAKKDIRSYEITARIEGRSENLRLRLDSSPALDRREILSVIFYGDTPDQLTEENRRQFTQTAAISQLAGILSQPIYKLSGLDVVKVTSRRETANQTIQRLSVGKSLSDRFDLTFTTDIGITEPERAFELRYQIFDNFYLIAAKDVTAERYRFDVNFHLDAY